MKNLLSATVFICSTLFSQSVNSHSFYNPWCCNGKDCKPYTKEVRVTPQGYFLPDYNVTIPFKNAAGSTQYAPEAGTRYDVPEGVEAEYYACIMPWEPTKIRCFGTRPGGV